MRKKCSKGATYALIFVQGFVSALYARQKVFCLTWLQHCHATCVGKQLLHLYFA